MGDTPRAPANVAGVIDIHNHLLPAIDDGPRTAEESVDMARLAVQAGITRMVCTPHVFVDDAPSPDLVARAVDDLRATLAHEDVPLAIETGAEIALDAAFELDDDALRGYSLGGGGWVLLELPFEGWPLRLPQFITDLEMRGFRAVLAHPERARAVQLSPDRLRDLVGRGALAQVTAGALLGDFGRMAQQVAGTLLRNGLVHFLASDAHGAVSRVPGLTQGLEEAARITGVEPAELGWMVTDGPRQLLRGGAVRPPRMGVPPPPERPRRDASPRPRGQGSRGDGPPRPGRQGGGDRPRGGGRHTSR